MNGRRLVCPNRASVHWRALVCTVCVLAFCAALLGFLAFTPPCFSSRGDGVRAVFVQQPISQDLPQVVPLPSIAPPPPFFSLVTSPPPFVFSSVEEVAFPSSFQPLTDSLLVDLEEDLPPTIVAVPRHRTVPPPSAAPAPHALAEGEAFTPPTYRAAPMPPYPSSLRQSGVEGRVRLRIFLDEEGRPRRVVVVQSSGYAAFDATAGDWVLRHWTFTPARRGERAVAATVVTQVCFVIQ